MIVFVSCYCGCYATFFATLLANNAPKSKRLLKFCLLVPSLATFWGDLSCTLVAMHITEKKNIIPMWHMVSSCTVAALSARQALHCSPPFLWLNPNDFWVVASSQLRLIPNGSILHYNFSSISFAMGCSVDTVNCQQIDTLKQRALLMGTFFDSSLFLDAGYSRNWTRTLWK